MLFIVIGVIVIALPALGAPALLNSATVHAISRIAALPQPAAMQAAGAPTPAVRPPAAGPASGR